MEGGSRMNEHFDEWLEKGHHINLSSILVCQIIPTYYNIIYYTTLNQRGFSKSKSINYLNLNNYSTFILNQKEVFGIALEMCLFYTI